MNFLDALKSGRFFRRPKYHAAVSDSVDWVPPFSPTARFSFTAEDMLATDWEVQAETIKVTSDAVKSACLVVGLSTEDCQRLFDALKMNAEP